MPATSLSDVLNSLPGAALDQSKQQLQDWVTQAKANGNAYIQSCGSQLEQWLIDLDNGDLTALEFNRLVAGQETVARNFVLQQSEDAQEQAENLTVNLLELAVTKIVPALLVAL